MAKYTKDIVMSTQNGPTGRFAEHEVREDTKTRNPFNLSSCTSCLRVLRVSRRLAVASFIVAVTSACVTTQGQTVLQRPPLDVPAAPPRVIAPLPPPEAPPVEEPPAEDPTGGKPLPPPKPKPPANAKPVTEKPAEPPPLDPIPAPVTTPPAPPTPTLSTPPPGDAGAVSKQIRDSIDRTRKALDGIDYRPLSNVRKKAYDDAKLFATQADDALKVNNLVFAKELADKAERLAKELQGR